QDRRLIRLQDDLEEAIELRELLLVRGLELLDEAVVALLPVLLEELCPLPPEFALGGAPNERVAMPHETQVRRVELLRLDEDLLAHADLAEVVQQGGVANFLELLAREFEAAIGTVAGTVDHLRKPDGHTRDAAAVTVGRRIAL